MKAGTIAGVLAKPLSERPDSVAVVARSGSLSYAELDRACDAAAGALWGRGVRPGDRVAACLPNDLDVVTAFHGAARVGAVWVGIGEALAEQEQRGLLAHCEPAVVLAGPLCKVDGGHVIPAEAWQGLCASADRAPAAAADRLGPDAPAGIAYTSGTTGQPKGVVHSHRNLLLPGQVLVSTRGWGPELRKGDSLPLTILNMLVLTTLLTAQAGGCAVVMDRRDPEGVADWIAREHVTVWNGVPAQLYDLARRPDVDLTALQEIWSGGGDLSDELRAAFRGTHGLDIRSTYGLTEAPTVVAIDPAGTEHRPTASGRVLPHLRVTARDALGNPCPAGDPGELVLEPATSGAFADRWTPLLGYWEDGAVAPAPAGPVATGDIGTVDDAGWLTVLDRAKLVIVRGGANVYPAEVERVLLAHPDVVAAAVFGVPDDRLGERVAVLVEPRSGDLDTDQLRAACASRLARYKVPEIWACVAALPTNAMGKVNRAGLPELLAATTQSSGA